MLEKTKVVRYSHGFYVKPGSKMCREALLEYCRTLIQWEYQKKPPTWRPQRVAKKVYAAATKDRTEFRFHINQYQEVMTHLSSYGLKTANMEFATLPVPKAQPAEFVFKKEMTPYEYQVPLIEFLSRDDKKIKVTNLQTGLGKDQPLDAKIKVPSGWKLMGDMQLGDKVVAHDGTISNVIGVYPQGNREIFEITFWDGRKTRAGADHLWHVYYINTSKHRRWRTVTTLELMRLLSMAQPRVYIPLCQSEQNPDIELPVPPYLLGAFIGDGSSSCGVNIHKSDSEIYSEIEKDLLPGYEFIARDDVTRYLRNNNTGRSNYYIDALRDLGLMGKRSYEKFIPERYLNGSTEQRWALLQGLMDTDGTSTLNEATGAGSISYSTTSLQLAKDVAHLVRSLGGIAHIGLRYPKYTYFGEKKEGRKAYIINIRIKNTTQAFRLPRKKERTTETNQYSDELKLRVRSVETIGAAETQCIAIDHPDHLYVTDDFIVTHNTLVSLMSMVNLGHRTLIQLRGGYVSRWTDELEMLFKFKKGDILVIRGRDSLMSLINMAREGELTAKIIIITNKTLFTFIKEHEENPNTNYYDCRPEELYELIECGLRIVDEVHEDYHFNFRSDVYCNIQSSIMLSATLETEDPFRRRMYDIAMPKECWYEGVDYVKYIDVYCAFYRMQDAENVRTSERGQDTYNHGAFEKSIMKEPARLSVYLEMIEDLVRRHYFLFDWGPNQKFLVFCYLVEFCELVRDHLQQAFPDVRIAEYVSGTPDDVLTQSEGLVSTVKSLGTAMDIKGLKTTIQTHALNKQESNIQALGRLRRMKQYPKTAPRFVYLTCENIPKHMDYHENKRKQFAGKVAQHLEEQLNFVV